MNSRLFTRDFSLLWLGKSVSQLGDGAGFIGLMWWVQSSTGSATALGIMAAISTLIRVALAPVSGVLADRLSKKTIIVLMDALRGVIYAALAFLAWSNQLSLASLILLASLNTICSVFFGPAITSAIPLLVSKDNLPRANSFLQMTGIIVQIASYSVGGILVALVGVPLLLMINGVSFILSAISELFINIPSTPAQESLVAGQFIQNVRQGLTYVRENTVLFKIMKTAAIINFVSAPLFILLPKFVGEHLGGSAEMYGYLLAAMATGTLLASLLIAFTKVVQRNVWTVMHGITFQGAIYITLVVIPRQWYQVHILLFLLTGFANGIVNIYFSSLLQRVVAQEHMGKVFGLLDAMSGALQPLSQGLTGVLGDRIAVGLIYIAAGGFGALGGLQFSLIPNLREWLSPAEDKTPRATHGMAATAQASD